MEPQQSYDMLQRQACLKKTEFGLSDLIAKVSMLKLNRLILLLGPGFILITIRLRLQRST
jgi:hypothetical protein